MPLSKQREIIYYFFLAIKASMKWYKLCLSLSSSVSNRRNFSIKVLSGLLTSVKISSARNNSLNVTPRAFCNLNLKIRSRNSIAVLEFCVVGRKHLYVVDILLWTNATFQIKEFILVTFITIGNKKCKLLLHKKHFHTIKSLAELRCWSINTNW